MTITLQNTEKGQCYAVKFDRYRQQVVDKLKSSVSIRWWDKQTNGRMADSGNQQMQSRIGSIDLLRPPFRTGTMGNDCTITDRGGCCFSNTGNAGTRRRTWTESTALPLSTARNCTRLATETVYQWRRYGTW